jgi:hypothetical protein
MAENNDDVQIVLNIMNNGKEGLKNIIIYQIVTKAIPFVVRGIIGGVKSLVQKKLEHHVKHITNVATKQKASSIVLSRDYEKDTTTNTVFDAILSFVSELPQTKHVKRTTMGVFMMATKEEIEVSPHIFVRKLNEVIHDDKVSKIFIEVYSYTYDLTTLRKYLDDVEEKYKMAISNQLGKNIFYFDEIPVSLPIGLDKKPDVSKAPSRLVFSKYVLYTNKSLKNIYGDAVKVVRKRVDFFVNNKRWYEEKGVPYTLGLLLHGVPGAGKTSCIKSIAKDTNRHILNIRITKSTTVTQLNNLFYSPQVMVVQNGENKVFDIPIDKRIIVLEDVDCLSDVVLDRTLKQDDEESEEKKKKEQENERDDPFGRVFPNQLSTLSNETLNLSTLLNILDGVLEQPGRILIMTSNHPEKLDKALIRPGRIDVIVHFNYCKKHEIAEIVLAFTNYKINKDELDNIIEDEFTPAEVTQIIFENFDDIPTMIKRFTKKKYSLDIEPSQHQENTIIIDNATLMFNNSEFAPFDEENNQINKLPLTHRNKETEPLYKLYKVPQEPISKDNEPLNKLPLIPLSEENNKSFCEGLTKNKHEWSSIKAQDDDNKSMSILPCNLNHFTTSHMSINDVSINGQEDCYFEDFFKYGPQPNNNRELKEWKEHIGVNILDVALNKISAP